MAGLQERRDRSSLMRSAATAKRPFPRNMNRDERSGFCIRVDVPEMRLCRIRIDADGRLPVLLRLHQLRRRAASEARRLLWLLLVRLHQLPADASPELLNMALDPVCGKTVDREKAAGKFDYQGTR